MNARHLIEASFEADLDKYDQLVPRVGDVVDITLTGLSIEELSVGDEKGWTVIQVMTSSKDDGLDHITLAKGNLEIVTFAAEHYNIARWVSRVSESFEADLDAYYNWRPKPGDVVTLKSTTVFSNPAVARWMRRDKPEVDWRVDSVDGDWAHLAGFRRPATIGPSAWVVVKIDDIIRPTIREASFEADLDKYDRHTTFEVGDIVRLNKDSETRHILQYYGAWAMPHSTLFKVEGISSSDLALVTVDPVSPGHVCRAAWCEKRYMVIVKKANT